MAAHTVTANSAIPSDAAIERWYDGKAFCADWTTWHFPNWCAMLARFRSCRCACSRSGRGRAARRCSSSTIFRARCSPASTRSAAMSSTTSIRYFAALVPETRAQVRRQRGRVRVPGREAQGAHRPRCCRSSASRRADSTSPISTAAIARPTCYSDAALTWPLIAKGGIVIFDDYEFDQMEEEIERPKLGIDAFLAAIDGQYRLVHKDYQVAIVKP